MVKNNCDDRVSVARRFAQSLVQGRPQAPSGLTDLGLGDVKEPGGVEGTAFDPSYGRPVAEVAQAPGTVGGRDR